MNYYRRYIGDYMRDTGHLSILEHGAYTLMLDTHYATEKPLPKGDALYRLLRAITEEERAAVDCVLAQFWVEDETGWQNAKAVTEIFAASARAITNKQNGKKGGNPLRKAKYNEPGIVYAVSVPDGRIKIGITKMFAKRLYQLRRTYGDANAIATVQVNDMGSVEAAILTAFAEYSDGELLDLNQQGLQSLSDAFASIKRDESHFIRANSDATNRESNHVTNRGESLATPMVVGNGSGDFDLDPRINPDLWQEFEAHRREIRKPLTTRSRKANAAVLADLTPEQQRASVTATIANRWTGLFPPKPVNGAGSGGKPSPMQRAAANLRDGLDRRGGRP